MTIRIDYNMIEDLPKLVWVASLDLERGRLTVLHCSAVECCDEWMVEGV